MTVESRRKTLLLDHRGLCSIPVCSLLLSLTTFGKLFKIFYLKKKLFLLIYLFLATLDLPCYVWAYSSCGKQRLLSSCDTSASLCSSFSHRRARSPECTGSVAWRASLVLLHDTWNLPRTGMEPMSPALAGRFLTTGPPGKSETYLNCASMPTSVMWGQ